MHDARSVVFTLAGYRVSAFADGGLFLATVRGHVPVCVLFDLHMPAMSTMDILKALNASELSCAGLRDFRGRRHCAGGRCDQERRL
jgi:FixJ family two-component response regulator